MHLVVAAAKNPLFGGRVHFLPDYDMALGAALVQGCDVWLNTPRRPLEASGTSGQKAGMNGCLNLSVPDGWWPEGYVSAHDSPNGIANGWSIGANVGEQDDETQDAADVASLFDLLEHEVVPLFYDHPVAWNRMVAESITTLTPKFAATRMLQDYRALLYGPAGHKGAA